MGRGKGARGGAGRGGGASLPGSPSWGLGPGTLFPPRFPALRGPSPGPLTRLPPGNPGQPRCPDPHPQLANPGRRPVTQTPPGTWGGSGSCSEPGPPFPSPAAPPHAFAYPGQPLLPWGRLRGPGGGGGRRSRAGKTTVSEARSLTRTFAPRFRFSPSPTRVCSEKIGRFEGRGTGCSGKRVDPCRGCHFPSSQDTCFIPGLVAKKGRWWMLPVHFGKNPSLGSLHVGPLGKLHLGHS